MNTNNWGKLFVLNLYNCSDKLIKNKNIIRDFIIKLCHEIKMKPFGKPLIKRFGKHKLLGYSCLQFIETSSITIHFDEIENRAFIDIFSCKEFDVEKVIDLSKRFFRANRVKSQVIYRN